MSILNILRHVDRVETERVIDVKLISYTSILLLSTPDRVIDLLVSHVSLVRQRSIEIVRMG